MSDQSRTGMIASGPRMSSSAGPAGPGTLHDRLLASLVSKTTRVEQTVLGVAPAVLTELRSDAVAVEDVRAVRASLLRAAAHLDSALSGQPA